MEDCPQQTHPVAGRSNPAIGNAKPVLVAGASGFVGSHIVRLLANRGRKVRVLLRKSSSIAALEGLPLDLVYGDVLDPASLRVAMNGCGSVFYSVVDPRFWLTDQTPIVRKNVEGLENAMDVALACGIDRFIFTSTMGTLGLNPDGPVDEDTPFNWLDRAPPYIRARLEAENRFLATCRDNGLPGVALCVANTYGPDDYQPTPHNGMLWQVASGQLNAVLDVAQPTVDIRDVAEAALLAETHGRAGERYIIANEFIEIAAFSRWRQRLATGHRRASSPIAPHSRSPARPKPSSSSSGAKTSWSAPTRSISPAFSANSTAAWRGGNLAGTRVRSNRRSETRSPSSLRESGRGSSPAPGRHR